ncbi:FAD-dependent monooxygenase [Streptomyces sp. NPDC047108]|uniref:FAD-dependent monooxygenase n=1 Tax=Streptomyces sp. NPDC047108 TaxID=3155025 RepID=UPI00341120E8
MRIAVTGGGPAGLAFAAFARLAGPPDEVTVWERRRAEDTYGFGVILPPAALDTLRRADPRAADALAPHLAEFDAITVHRHGRSLTTPAPHLGAVSRRTLLRILRQRCAELGVRLHQGDPAPGTAALTARFDLVVAADGARSATRAALAGEFGTTTERIAPDYIWLGAERAFGGLSFVVADSPRGPAVAHAYPYGPDRSTVLVEAAHRPDTRELDRLFAEPLAGARLLKNRSRWSRFLQVRNRTWSSGNVVLLGDAAHTAHYSIGSGTRLALDDAHALVTALRSEPSLGAALAAYEAARRPAVEHTQRIGLASAAWFAGLADSGDGGGASGMPPERFLVDLLTRGGRISMRDLAADATGAVPAGTVVSSR